MAETAMKLRGFIPEAQQPEQQGKTFGDRLKDLRQKVGGLFGRGSNIDILEPGASVGATPQGEELHHEPSIHVPGGVKGLGLPPEDAGQNVMDTNVTTEAGTLFNGSGEEPDHELEPEENREEQDEAAQAAPDVVSTEAIVGQQSTEATGEEGLLSNTVGGTASATTDKRDISSMAAELLASQAGALTGLPQPLRVGAPQPATELVGKDYTQDAENAGVLAEAKALDRKSAPLGRPSTGSAAPGQHGGGLNRRGFLKAVAGLGLGVLAEETFGPGFIRKSFQGQDGENGAGVVEPPKTAVPATKTIGTTPTTGATSTTAPATSTPEAPTVVPNPVESLLENRVSYEGEYNGAKVPFTLGVDAKGFESTASYTRKITNLGLHPDMDQGRAAGLFAEQILRLHYDNLVYQKVEGVPASFDEFAAAVAGGKDFTYSLSVGDSRFEGSPVENLPVHVSKGLIFGLSPKDAMIAPKSGSYSYRDSEDPDAISPAALWSATPDGTLILVSNPINLYPLGWNGWTRAGDAQEITGTFKRAAGILRAHVHNQTIAVKERKDIKDIYLKDQRLPNGLTGLEIIQKMSDHLDPYYGVLMPTTKDPQGQ